MQESNMKKREKKKYPEWVTCRKRYKSMLCFQQKKLRTIQMSSLFPPYIKGFLCLQTYSRCQHNQRRGTSGAHIFM